MNSFTMDKTRMPTPDEAPAGRDTAIVEPGEHRVTGRPLAPPYPEETRQALFGMGCFWGAEQVFWQLEGVYVTAVGYAGGFTPHPTYEEVCGGRTGHAEVVRVVYYPDRLNYNELLRAFWENHDSTQGMRQGNDVGTQYRSAIYVYNDEQRGLARLSMEAYQRALRDAGYGEITTEIESAPEFYFAENYHQQYLAQNPGGYCGLGSTGVRLSL
jgi:peptide-methionine (S)-S-oxide reductase